MVAGLGHGQFDKRALGVGLITISSSSVRAKVLRISSLALITSLPALSELDLSQSPAQTVTHFGSRSWTCHNLQPTTFDRALEVGLLSLSTAKVYNFSDLAELDLSQSPG